MINFELYYIATKSQRVCRR